MINFMIKSAKYMIFSLLVFGQPLGAAAQGAETYLVMVHEDNCPWCEAFEDEVGKFYHKTPESEKLPLKRIDYQEKMPSHWQVNGAALFTPTFIILHEGVEKGRIEGYPGRELFWWRLSEFMQ